MDEDRGSAAPETAKPQFDEAQVQYALDQLRGEQNLAVGSAAGVFGALAGASIWAVVTVITGYQIGLMAIGVGILVGIAIRTFGKGIDKVFGIVGAVLALIGCGLGNLLAVCGTVAAGQEVGFLEIVSRLDLTIAKELMVATFSPIDLLFYGIAVYEGYKFSFRPLTEQDLAARITGQTAGG